MMRPIILATIAIAALPALGQSQDFNWQGRIAPGRRLEVKGVNGDVRAVAVRSGTEAVVRATKRAEDSDPAEVKIEVIEDSGGVTICAVYPTPRRARRENSCQVGDE